MKHIDTSPQLPAVPLGLSIADFLQRVPIGRTTLWRMTKEKRIKTVRFGARVIIPMSEVDRLLNAKEDVA